MKQTASFRKACLHPICLYFSDLQYFFVYYACSFKFLNAHFQNYPKKNGRWKPNFCINIFFSLSSAATSAFAVFLLVVMINQHFAAGR